MKKIALIMVFAVLLTSMVFASDGLDLDVKYYQTKNVLPGFGAGSRLQGDLDTARLLLGLDITATALTVTGGLALTGSILFYGLVKAYVGEVTRADIYISAGVLGAGLATLVVSKVLGFSMPLKY